MPPKSPHQKRQYWLFKSEPEAFSIQDLAAQPNQTTFWDGVRNYQARNFLRDSVKAGDRVFFYHSNADPLAIVGTAEVVKEGYPDHTAWDPNDHHFDPKSDPDNPTWYMVDIRLIQIFKTPVTREMLAHGPVTSGMQVMKKGQRLSIQTVTPEEWAAAHAMATAKDRE